MNEVEVYRLRERLTRLVREEPEVVAALWGRRGRVTRRVGEGLRLHGGEP